jgi:drug/metabolite transporter (DMT)-like permease
VPAGGPLTVSRHAAHIPLAAIGFILAAVGCFSLLDATVKHLTGLYPVALIVFARYAIQEISMVLWLAPSMRWNLLRTTQPGLQIARGTILLLSSVCFVNALRFLPLADATAINYTTPILVVLLSVLILGERMTRARTAFVVGGFVGMVLIVRPGASILHGGALFALAAAGFYAVYQILTRMLRGDDPRVTLFYPALCGTFLMLPALPFLDHSASMPWVDIALVAVTGLLGTAGHFLFILAFQRAPASGLTPFTYVQLVWAILLGWLFYAQFPDVLTLVGIGVIAASGLLLAWHERRRARGVAVVEEPPAID